MPAPLAPADRMLPVGRTPRAPIVVVGLGYGDEAKGATVDALAAAIPDTTAVVRWSGGAQAAHNVIHGPRHHAFHQFGSASFLDIGTLLRAPMLIDPLQLAIEATELVALGVRDPLGLVTADARCLVTTPIHAALNRAREILRGAAPHGSCGVGIGETVAYDLAVRSGARCGDTVGNFVVPGPITATAAPTLAMLRDRAATVRALDALATYAAPLLGAVAHPDAVHPDVATMASALCDIAGDLRMTVDADEELRRLTDRGTLIFEGRQGVLLDEWNGFHPHTTWATTSPRPLVDELRAAGRDPFVLGVTRCYATRHGAGPMPTEDRGLVLPEPHNREGRYQGAWRTGHLDLPALRYAAAVCGGVDGVALTHLDALASGELRVADSWDGDRMPIRPIGVEDLDALEGITARVVAADPDERPLPRDPDAVCRIVAEAVGAPVVGTAHGPARGDRTFLPDQTRSATQRALVGGNQAARPSSVALSMR